jgi:hypothetical protein
VPGSLLADPRLAIRGPGPGSTIRTCKEPARTLELDIERFERPRSETVAECVARDFRSGVRAGVMTTQTLVVEGVRRPGVPDPELLERLVRGRRPIASIAPDRTQAKHE